ncbi:ATP-binding protein [Eleftheria terrae]|uniref:ATP-binding protein n=1 Tax=Eleftheria terrae TaxID=1597781 RepID=UPI00263B9B00|nr:ATP-binding protein [Eleftheria terrae]WKB50902.1 ATP-binding protein [Eleftheria terrae]
MALIGEATVAVTQYRVEVEPDHLEKNARAKPVQALSELIWNGLDADADRVSVSFEHNAMGTLDRVTVRDNGLGLQRSEAAECFRKLGGSWKKNRSTTPSGRHLHGQEGRGRFKAFAIGSHAEWEVVYDKGGTLWSYKISMSTSDIRHVAISDEAEAAPGVERGVTLVVSNPHKDYRTLDSDAALDELTEIFALYLSDYENLRVTVGGRRVDPTKVMANRQAFNLSDIVSEGKNYPVRLELIEWNGISQRALFLCNDKKFPLVHVGRRFHVGNFQFTAYLQSPYMNKTQKDGVADLAEMQEPVILALDEAQRAIKDYFRMRAASEASSFVQEWKSEKIYPYVGDPATQVEYVERQVFDIVALNVARHLPEFSRSPPKNKQFQLRMLRQAIEKSPEDLQLILTEVLNLPKRKRDELAGLLQDVSLSSIISSAKVVADRIKFVAGLDAILFDDESKKRLKERTQLHRIIAENCWLFGEEFTLSVDDRSLTEVLRAHMKILGEEVVIDAPVKHVSQTRGIVDLMLSKATRRHKANEVTHLVVELKRPKVSIDSDEITQIEKYAFSVAADERFKGVGVRWIFWVISDSYGEYAARRIADESGQIYKKDNVSVYVKTWAQVLDENRARLQFFQERLEFQADKGDALKYLQERHAQYLEGVFDDGFVREQDSESFNHDDSID